MKDTSAPYVRPETDEDWLVRRASLPPVPLNLEQLRKLMGCPGLVQKIAAAGASTPEAASLEARLANALGAVEEAEAADIALPAEKDLDELCLDLGVAITTVLSRIPLFLYLTDHREASLIEVIETLDGGLVEKVIGISQSCLQAMHRVGVLRSEELNPAIWHFKKFEEMSLTYAGGKHVEDMTVGLWDTTLHSNSQVATLHQNPDREGRTSHAA